MEGWSEVLAKQKRINTENLARRITVVQNEAEQLNNHKNIENKNISKYETGYFKFHIRASYGSLQCLLLGKRKLVLPREEKQGVQLLDV